MTNTQFLKISEAAKALNVSLETLRRWEKTGKILATRTPGGTRLYSAGEINKILSQKKDNKIFISPQKEVVSQRTLYRWARSGIIPSAQKAYVNSALNQQIEFHYTPSNRLKFRLGLITIFILSFLAILPAVNHKSLAQKLPNSISISTLIYSNVSTNPTNTESSAFVQNRLVETKQLDKRAQILKDYLAQFNSPLQYHTQDLVDAADANDVDWKLIVSIAGAESTFGKKIPGGTNPQHSSFNGWGWGVYGDNVLYFDSWREALFKVSKGIKNGYADKGLSNPEQMNIKYSSSPFWADSVSYFMRDIEEFAKQYEQAPVVSHSQSKEGLQVSEDSRNSKT